MRRLRLYLLVLTVVALSGLLSWYMMRKFDRMEFLQYLATRQQALRASVLDGSDGMGAAADRRFSFEDVKQIIQRSRSVSQLDSGKIFWMVPVDDVESPAESDVLFAEAYTHDAAGDTVNVVYSDGDVSAAANLDSVKVIDRGNLRWRTLHLRDGSLVGSE